MNPDEERMRKDLSHALWIVGGQINALAAAVFEPVRQSRPNLLDRPALTDEQIFEGVELPPTPEQAAYKALAPERECLTG